MAIYKEINKQIAPFMKTRGFARSKLHTLGF